MIAAQQKQYRTQAPGALSVQATIVRFFAQAVWFDSDLEMKSHLTKMCDYAESASATPEAPRSNTFLELQYNTPDND